MESTSLGTYARQQESSKFVVENTTFNCWVGDCHELLDMKRGDLVLMTNEFGYGRTTGYSRVKFTSTPMIVLEVNKPYLKILKTNGDITEDRIHNYKTISSCSVPCQIKSSSPEMLLDDFYFNTHGIDRTKQEVKQSSFQST